MRVESQRKREVEKPKNRGKGEGRHLLPAVCLWENKVDSAKRLWDRQVLNQTKICGVVGWEGEMGGKK